jgi:hypothetical protein
MMTKTFQARVENGQLQHQEALHAFEGQQVQVTLVAVAPPSETPNGAAGSTEPEPPEWLDVEKDIYVQMPRRVETLKDVVIVDKGRRPPCIVVPEELPDD